MVEDEETNKRIEIRQQDIPKKVNGINCFELSDFTTELFQFVMGISRNAGVLFRRIQEISKYPELVKESLKQFEKTEVKTKKLEK